MEYNGLLISLMKPHLVIDVDEAQELPTLHLDASPLEILSEAKLRLETLLRLHYQRHSFVCCDPYLIYFLVLLGYMVLGELDIGKANSTSESRPTNHEALRSTLVLCATGLYNQAQHMHLGTSSLVAFRGCMKSEEESLLTRYVALQDADGRQPIASQHHQTAWVLPVVTLIDDPKNASIEALVNVFRKAMLDEPSDASRESSLGP